MSYKKTDQLLRTIGPMIFWKATLRSQQVVGFIAEPSESGSFICFTPFLGYILEAACGPWIEKGKFPVSQAGLDEVGKKWDLR